MTTPLQQIAESCSKLRLARTEPERIELALSIQSASLALAGQLGDAHEKIIYLLSPTPMETPISFRRVPDPELSPEAPVSSEESEAK